MTTETTTNDTPADAAAPAQTTALGDAATTTEGAEGAEPVADKDAAAGEAEGANKEGGDPSADADAPIGAPEAYDSSAWSMPEGVEFDQEGFDAVEPVLRDLNLTNDQAGTLMGAYAEKIVPMIEARTEKRMADAAQELSANLARDVQADPEVGGAKLTEAKAHAAKAIAHGIPDATKRSEFSQFLNESGLGNHPLLVRVLASAGRALGEASTPAAGNADTRTPEQKFFNR